MSQISGWFEGNFTPDDPDRSVDKIHQLHDESSRQQLKNAGPARTSAAPIKCCTRYRRPSPKDLKHKKDESYLRVYGDKNNKNKRN